MVSQFIIAGMVPRKEEMKSAALARGKQVQDMCIDIRLNTKADPVLLDEISTLIYCTHLTEEIN